ncbi:MAG: hypothetical protein WD766_00250 [Gemmatimonadota bacterium]
MRISRTFAVAVAVGAAAIVGQPAVAQEGPLDQLMELPRTGGVVSPMFDGWYRNPDGSITVSFGYINLNREESPVIPIGENNYIEPAQFNGMQPTYFPAIQYGGFGGKHERGVFAVTIPAEMADTEVVWTVNHNDRTWKIPAAAGVLEYQLSYTPATEGSLPPSLRFGDGELVQGREGIVGPRVTTSVGAPATLSVYAQDEGTRDRKAVNVTWFNHQGPGEVEFGTKEAEFEAGTGDASTTATFTEAGEYLIRVRADNFGAGDSRPSNQCCWSNAYVPVTVTP